MSETIDDRFILVTGATGKQGGATARALLAKSIPVRALVRNPEAPNAVALAEAGVELVKGDLDDKASLEAAVRGARAVFSVQMPDMADLYSDSEMIQGRNLVEAARGAGVEQFVHTSVSGAVSDFQRIQKLEGSIWYKTHLPNYWKSKVYVEDCVKGAGFTYWSILRPAFFMENFIKPSFMFANWVEDRIVTTILPESTISLIAVQDIGRAAAEIFSDPAKFNAMEIELAGDRMTMRDIATVLSDAMRVPLQAPTITLQEAIDQGIPDVLAIGGQWNNEVGPHADPETSRELGLPTRNFRSWALDVLSPQK